MFLSAALSILGLGLLCWALFTLAVYALPFFVAVSAGLYLCEAEIGLMIAVAAALIAGAATLLAGQIAFATIRSVPIRLAIGVLYALPAGVAGFHAIKGLSELGDAGETSTLVFASIGALVAGTAWARVATLAGPDEGTLPPTSPTFAGPPASAAEPHVRPRQAVGRA